MRRIVGLDRLDHFEEDEAGNLYWKGNRVIVEQRLVIPTVVNVAVIAAGLGAVVSAIFAGLTYLWPSCPI